MSSFEFISYGHGISVFPKNYNYLKGKGGLNRVIIAHSQLQKEGVSRLGSLYSCKMRRFRENTTEFTNSRRTL